MVTQEAEAGGPQVPHKHALHSKIPSQTAKQSKIFNSYAPLIGWAIMGNSHCSSKLQFLYLYNENSYLAQMLGS